MTENEAIRVLRRSYSYSLKDQKQSLKMAIKALEEVQEYRKIGTVEECLEAAEKQKPKKIKYKNRHGDGADLWNKDYFNCPCCGRRLRNKQKDNHCGRCGQKLYWGDKNE